MRTNAVGGARSGSLLGSGEVRPRVMLMVRYRLGNALSLVMRLATELIQPSPCRYRGFGISAGGCGQEQRDGEQQPVVVGAPGLLVDPAFGFVAADGAGLMRGGGVLDD